MAKAVKTKKQKVKIKVVDAKAFVQSTFNNTIITITDQSGNVLAWGSAGQAGFKGAKKSTPYAAQVAAGKAAEAAKAYGIENVAVFVKGVGSGREGAVRALNAAGFYVKSIKDITGVPHNGCRPKKPRRT